MKIDRIETLISAGSFAKSSFWKKTKKFLTSSIQESSYPSSSGGFIINPTDKGNGVVPIKSAFMKCLQKADWKLEHKFDIASVVRPGKIDAAFSSKDGIIVLEWETGNISSSHRALNKMALGLMKGIFAAGILIVPTRRFYRYLTDRVGNFSELEPYFDLWKSIPCANGVLEIIAIEHDGVSDKSPLIRKGTDGRALR